MATGTDHSEASREIDIVEELRWQTRYTQGRVPYTMERAAKEIEHLRELRETMRKNCMEECEFVLRADAANQIKAAKSLLANWDEFGPDGGLDDYIEALRAALSRS